MYVWNSTYHHTTVPSLPVQATNNVYHATASPIGKHLTNEILGQYKRNVAAAASIQSNPNQPNPKALELQTPQYRISIPSFKFLFQTLLPKINWLPISSSVITYGPPLALLSFLEGKSHSFPGIITPGWTTFNITRQVNIGRESRQYMYASCLGIGALNPDAYSIRRKIMRICEGDGLVSSEIVWVDGRKGIGRGRDGACLRWWEVQQHKSCAASSQLCPSSLMAIDFVVQGELE